jgi:hypothetical protein
MDPEREISAAAHRHAYLRHAPFGIQSFEIGNLKALRESLGKIPGYVSSCLPEYRHGVAFVSGGHRYDVLLCYQCGQVRVVIDGDEEGSANGQTYSMGSQAALNAILRKARIPLAKAARESSGE